MKFRDWAVLELQLVLFEKSLQYGISDGILCNGTLLPGGIHTRMQGCIGLGTWPPKAWKIDIVWYILTPPHFLYAALRMHA